MKIRNDSFNQTNNTLGIYKNFVTQKLDDEFELSKADKIDLLNRSMKYLRKKKLLIWTSLPGSDRQPSGY